VYVIDFYLPSRKLEEREAELLQLQTKLESLLISSEDKDTQVCFFFLLPSFKWVFFKIL
jgi:hypothetical protein